MYGAAAQSITGKDLRYDYIWNNVITHYEYPISYFIGDAYLNGKAKEITALR